jgi:hypothetical protein
MFVRLPLSHSRDAVPLTWNTMRGDSPLPARSRQHGPEYVKATLTSYMEGNAARPLSSCVGRRPLGASGRLGGSPSATTAGRD